MAAGSIRARVRAEMITEIKDVARRHLATDGANLSLRAVARDMGMVSSALYRYFASRDDLLTALIIDAYTGLGDAIETAEAGVTERLDLRGRWIGACRGVRRWALANTSEYALIYGSPVPGYAAPQETTVAAARTPTTLIRILTDGYAAGLLTEPPEMIAPAVRKDLDRILAAVDIDLPLPLLIRGITGWLHLFGVVSFELFGQLNNVIEARDEFFDGQMSTLADMIGLMAGAPTANDGSRS